MSILKIIGDNIELNGFEELNDVVTFCMSGATLSIMDGAHSHGIRRKVCVREENGIVIDEEVAEIIMKEYIKNGNEIPMKQGYAINDGIIYCQKREE